MGGFCSRSASENYSDTPEDHERGMEDTYTRQLAERQARDREAAQRLIRAHHANIERLPKPAEDLWAWETVDELLNSAARGHNLVDAYEWSRLQLKAAENTMNFDYTCRANAVPLEHRVNKIIRRIRQDDEKTVYQGFRQDTEHGQKHPRFPGDHFLGNVDLINETKLLKIAQMMPKGAHLHIHFNSCLRPNVLLDIAKGTDRMFITSDLPLTSEENRKHCEIQFRVLSKEKELLNPGDLHAASYQPDQTMHFGLFRDKFDKQFGKGSVDRWLEDKVVFKESESHNLLTTASRVWQKFDGRTRMLKGLFNYETAYRRYTRLLLEDLVRDNIQYAEIRPNFMTTNQVWYDDGSGMYDNRGIMNIIIEEVHRFKKDFEGQMQRVYEGEGRFFGTIKVIYCTPRSFDQARVEAALTQCIEFKKEWPEWIAGFDLVGEEGAGKPLKAFLPQFLDFRQKCEREKLDIPFLFHCGETTDLGSDTDHNLFDALLLNSKRIGHGFALSQHPYVMEQMKARNVCLELCPISNEVLGLIPRASAHSMYPLLQNNVHCTVNSDNGTFFKSTLSHDFYQVMIGKADMDLFGWKQLAMWSLEHSCLNKEEYKVIVAGWHEQWEQFLLAVEKTFGGLCS